jgi:hypothetical protein
VKTTRLVSRALKERWPIPAALRSALLERMQRLAEDLNASPREVVAAMRTVLEASRVNIEAIAVELQVRGREGEEPRPGAPEIVVPDIDRRYGSGGSSDDEGDGAGD